MTGESPMRIGLGDMTPGLSDELKTRVNSLGTKIRVLLSSGILPPSMLLILSIHITKSALDNKIDKLDEIEQHLNVGLRVAANQFPYGGCEECGSLEACSAIMEGVEKANPEEANQLIAMLEPPIGTA